MQLVAEVATSDGLGSYRRRPPSHRGDAEGLRAAIVALKGAASATSGLRPGAIGAGYGGPMRYPAGIVSPPHISAWRDFPLADRLAAVFRMPVCADNDAGALAPGEARFGAGRGAGSLLGMVVSTGIDGGIVVDGRLRRGASGNADHSGHAIVAAGGPVERATFSSRRDHLTNRAPP